MTARPLSHLFLELGRLFEERSSLGAQRRDRWHSGTPHWRAAGG